ncbi:MAG: NAD-dependent epimerase/dehydratase family protein [Candidatus Micrarchaeia archaeon]
MQKGSKIAFVTGGNGKLGSRICSVLLNEGYTVRALVRDKTCIPSLPSGVIPFLGTLDDTNVIDEATEGADLVVHTAAIVGETNTTVLELRHVNYEGTLNVINSCIKANCKHLIFTSTIDVYGKKVKGQITEETPTKPTDRYGYSKLAAEQAIMQSGLTYTIFRMATIYGPGFESHFFKIFEAIMQGKVAIIGDGKNHLAIVHIFDVLTAILLAIQKGNSANQIYNLADGVPHTQEELIDLAADMLNASKPERHISRALIYLLAKKKGLDSDELRFLTSDRIVDITKIEKELGFKPKIDIKTGGAELVEMFIKSRKVLT